MINIEFIRKYILCIYFFISVSNCLLSQDSLKKEGNLSWNVFVDVYYSYDFTNPANHEKASFLYNHKRHNEVNINLALVNLSYNNSTKRANLGLMAGTYPQYNLAAEPELLRHIYEANVGIRITKNKEVWLDAGILPSHIGFETAISMNCWTLTRSILAENSPYYETGVRASYKTPNQKWYMAVMFLNGWQRIIRVDGNNTPSFGTQITYTPTDKLSINSSTFIGNDKPDSVRKWRYFHNFYSTWQLSRFWGIIVGLDVGWEQKQRGSAEFNSWYSPVVIIRYQNMNWAIAARAEYYNDKNGSIVPLVNQYPFQMEGYSLNLDWTIYKGIMWRVEGRFFRNPTEYFSYQSSLSKSDFFFTTGLSFSF